MTDTLKRYRLLGEEKTIPEWVELFPYLWGKDLMKYNFVEVLPVSEPVPDKIEVMNFVGRKKYTDERCTDTIYEFNSTRQIPLDRFPAIKQAIESCLNELLPQPPSEVDAIRADTWYAARKITDKVVGEIDFKDGDRCPFYEKYFNSINDILY